MVKVLEAIVLMALVTYGSRVLPLVALRGIKIEGFVRRFIELVPVALLAALVVPELIMPGGYLSFINPFLLAGILTFIFAKYVPNLFAGIAFGMIAFWGFDKFLR